MTIDAARSADPPERTPAHDVRLRLEHERDSRLSQLDAVEEAADQASADLLAVQTDSARRVLAEIDLALARLENGTYGICEGCGSAIPAERLEILPYASRCVGCQQRSA
ncbi:MULTISPECIES: TraR/DksA C4-type zinc finger protein [Streptomyces]|uniref:Transcriptional regulator, TraR/DksA family n=1 Tax=Streptomyces pini TaxID=1520580 RepID=A0A1I4L929_9ACTN|nr:TraR/DksA C4-type zinc finger protein [Streptomyces pini]SFL87157.1 transcriptional regulator, TraR/DksA family [Streptomyces pini]